MMKRLLTASLFIFVLFSIAAAELIETVEKPFEMRVYKLDNGLTLYLSKNPREPRVKVMTAVRTGSLMDPSDSTGLAHYFEHMMFKGNEKIAALDPDKEKVLLDRIEQLFEDYRKEKDTEKRAAIYKQIDALSLEASKYSNDEYWLIVNALGGKGLNAWTSYDETVYLCDIPVNQLKRFLILEAERFSSIRLRRFHTELETVYEEYNRSQDSDLRQAYTAMLKGLYRDHPYGRSVIGLPEHLKSPSMRDIRMFFDMHYKPENMALVLTGDIDYEKTLAEVEASFGKLKNRKTWPCLTMPVPPPPCDSPILEVTGPESEFVMLGWSFAMPDKRDELMLDMLSNVLRNGKNGIFERELILPQKIQSVDLWISYGNEAYTMMIIAKPKKGQTLEEVRTLLLESIAKAANGSFDESMPQAIANNERIKLEKNVENRSSTANYAVNSFIRQQKIKDALAEYDAMEKVTKKEICEFARSLISLNEPVTVMKRTGEAKREHAVKPPITPIEVTSEESAFAAAFAKLAPEAEPAAVFPDFEKGIQKNLIADDLKLYSMKNTENERFTLTYYFPGGSLFNRELAVALDYIQLLGTDKYTPLQLGDELYKYALDFSSGSSPRYCYVSISGLQKNFSKAVELLEHIINNVKPDGDAWKKYVERVATDRENQMKDPSAISSSAIQYILYGKDNMTTAITPLDTLRASKAETFAALVKSLPTRTHDVVYYGPADGKNVAEHLAAVLKISKTTTPLADDTQHYKIKPPEHNTVYLLDLPLQQMLVTLIKPDAEFKTKPYTFEMLYSEYGPRLSMNELREKRALAYSAYTYYTNPGVYPENYSLVIGQIGTQSDKLDSAVSGILNLLESKEINKELFDASKKKTEKDILSKRYLNESLYSTREALKRLGLSEPPEKAVLAELQLTTPEKFAAMCKEHLTGKKYSLLIIGDTKKIDRETLKKYGDIKLLTVNDIFPVK